MTLHHTSQAGSSSRLISRRSFIGAASLTFAGLGCFLSACSSGSAASASASSASAASSTSGRQAASSSDMQQRTIFVFDTEVSLSAVCSADLMDKAVERCNYFESIFSRTVSGSDVWRINEAAGQPVEVASETADCIRASLEYSRLTQGLFDITIGAVSSLWDFHKGIKPDEDAISQALPHIGYQKVTVQGTTVQLADPQAKIDLGGIAKGYIADDLHALFTQAGCTSGIINLGGNVMLIGAKPDGSNWNVGVQDPNNARNECIASVECADKSVVTSGLYERYFQSGDETYYHILDPKTGYPAQTDLLASSVYSDSSMDGDAFATALFIMGKQQALDFIEQRPGVEALVVDSADAVFLSSGAPFALLKG